MLDELSEEQFQEWRAAFRLDPWDEDRADLRSAIVASIVDADRAKASRVAPAKNYMPYHREPPKAVDEEKQRQSLDSFAAKWNRR